MVELACMWLAEIEGELGDVKNRGQGIQSMASAVVLLGWSRVESFFLQLIVNVLDLINTNIIRSFFSKSLTFSL